MKDNDMILNNEPSSSHRGSSPAPQTPHGTDDWVRGMRSSNATAEEWFAGESDESGTLPLRPSPQTPGTTTDAAVDPLAPPATPR